jgi:NADPH-dependent 2,4-dienoyl-CoA reductase/sulfur reductase-like enzyme
MAEAHPPDPASIAGKPLDVAERTELLVIGAGPAGVAAALAARRHGLQVVLVDENPVPADSMGEDIPLLFGQRAGAVRNRNAMMEAVTAGTPRLEEALEAGVDVRLGTVVWGLYANGPSVHWLPGRIAGMTDGERSWLMLFEQVIVATGRRDMGLAFPGWELPGVMGATAAETLSAKYGALDVRRAVVLGSTAEALCTTLALHAAGVQIVAVLEQAAAPVGPQALLERVVSAGIPLHCSHAVDRLDGRAGVDAVVAIQTGPDGRHQPGSTVRFDCDTVILGIGTVPVVELLDAAGCGMAFQPERGGYVPVLEGTQRCSLPGFYAVGDCAGIWPEKSLDAAVSRDEGIRAVVGIAAARGLGQTTTDDRPASLPAASGFDLAEYRLGWVRASVIGAAGEPYVCRCEEVTAREILEVRPPRYLGREQIDRPDRSLQSMLGAGAPNPDHIKRLTRAGMGVCQGRRCREQIQALLALGAGVSLAQIPLASYRAPVRPLALRLAGQSAEAAAITQHWDTWFGMASQYTPPWEIIKPYTVADRKLGKVASE